MTSIKNDVKNDQSCSKHIEYPSLLSITGKNALIQFEKYLSIFEKKEILDYNEVYYCGQEAFQSKIISEEHQTNNGFDDENGKYKCVINDHIAYRYKLGKLIGKGTYGDCYKAFDFKKNIWVALKILKNIDRFYKQGLMEVQILDILRKEGNKSIVNFYDHFKFRNHLIITFELLDVDLYKSLKLIEFSGFDISYTRKICIDVLRCLSFLSKINIVHGDLKPENILTRKKNMPDSVCKVIDFGSSCLKHKKIHTYVQSRYYRAPEIILGLGYGLEIDMWSLGTILAEIDSGYPLFPARNEKDLILYQMKILGIPPTDVYNYGSRYNKYFLETNGEPIHFRDYTGRKIHPNSRKLENKLKSNTNLEFIDFIKKCLIWDPKKRMTPDEAFEHPWIKGKN